MAGHSGPRHNSIDWDLHRLGNDDRRFQYWWHDSHMSYDNFTNLPTLLNRLQLASFGLSFPHTKMIKSGPEKIWLIDEEENAAYRPAINN